MYVKNSMTANPYIISPDASISDALELMRENSIRRLPVVKDGKLVGIVTEREIQGVSPSKATTLSVHEINYLLEKTKVSAAMSKKLITISTEAFLEEAAVLMRDNKISTLPVMKDGKLVGIITETDIFTAFIDILGFKDIGSRIAVSASDSPGTLSKIAKVIGDKGANIAHVAVYNGKAGRSDIIITVNTMNSEPIAEALREQGYEILDVIKNK